MKLSSISGKGLHCNSTGRSCTKSRFPKLPDSNYKRQHVHFFLTGLATCLQAFAVTTGCDSNCLALLARYDGVIFDSHRKHMPLVEYNYCIINTGTIKLSPSHLV